MSAPGRVLDIEGDDAVVDLGGRRRRAALHLRSDIRVGDWVLVGAGSVLRRLDADEAALIVGALEAAIASSNAPSASTTDGGPS